MFDSSHACIQTIIDDCSTWISESHVIDKLIKGEYCGPTRNSDEMEIEDSENSEEIKNQMLIEDDLISNEEVNTVRNEEPKSLGT